MNVDHFVALLVSSDQILTNRPFIFSFFLSYRVFISGGDLLKLLFEKTVHFISNQKVIKKVILKLLFYWILKLNYFDLFAPFLRRQCMKTYFVLWLCWANGPNISHMTSDLVQWSNIWNLLKTNVYSWSLTSLEIFRKSACICCVKMIIWLSMKPTWKTCISRHFKRQTRN